MNEYFEQKSEQPPSPEQLLRRAASDYARLKAELAQVGISDHELQALTGPFQSSPDYHWSFSVREIHLCLEALGVTEQSLIPIIIEDLQEIRKTLRKLAQQES